MHEDNSILSSLSLILVILALCLVQPSAKQLEEEKSTNMSPLVFTVVLGAALLHAIWNAAVKGSDDKLLGMSAIIFGHSISGIICLFYFDLPSMDSMPYILAGLLIHFGYQIFLISSYKLGDFSQVYPIARGSAPLVVTLVSMLFLGDKLKPLELIAIGLIVLGLMSLSLVRQKNGLRNKKAALMALITGFCIAGYSLVDGLGAIKSGSPFGYFAVLSIINTLFFSCYLYFKAPEMFARVWHEGKQIIFIGASISYLGYALAIWAFTQASIPLVTALRETSIIYALMIGIFFFKEKLTPTKIVATLLTVTGAILLRLATW